MDKSTIVIYVNIAFCALYLVVLWIRNQQYADKTYVSDQNGQIPIEYAAYTLTVGVMFIPMLTFPLFRNHHIFNHSFPVSFILQFAAQFIILLFFIIDTKATRYMATWGIAGFLIFMAINGLFRMEANYNKLELTTLEIQEITEDLDKFSTDVTERIKKVNSDMNSVLFEIKERQKQIETINNMLKEKEKEYENVRIKLDVDKEKADEILKALGVRPPTITDRLIDAGTGAILGLLLSIIWDRLFGKRAPLKR